VRASVRTRAHATRALPTGLDIVRGYPDRHEYIVATFRGIDAVCSIVFRAAAHDRFLGQKVYVPG